MTASVFKTQAAEIEQLARYLRNDKTIANYFGIPTEQVTAVRSRMRRRATVPHRRAENALDHTLPPVQRDPCGRCGVRGDIGCAHRRAG